MHTHIRYPFILSQCSHGGECVYRRLRGRSCCVRTSGVVFIQKGSCSQSWCSHVSDPRLLRHQKKTHARWQSVLTCSTTERSRDTHNDNDNNDVLPLFLQALVVLVLGVVTGVVLLAAVPVLSSNTAVVVLVPPTVMMTHHHLLQASGGC